MFFNQIIIFRVKYCVWISTCIKLIKICLNLTCCFCAGSQQEFICIFPFLIHEIYFRRLVYFLFVSKISVGLKKETSQANIFWHGEYLLNFLQDSRIFNNGMGCSYCLIVSSLFMLFPRIWTISSGFPSAPCLKSTPLATPHMKLLHCCWILSFSSDSFCTNVSCHTFVIFMAPS